MRGLGLEVLSKDPDPEVRRAATAADGYYFGDYVAERRNPEHLDRTLYANLTQKQKDWVRSGNAASRRRAVEAALGLDYLFDDPNPIVRQAVASRGYALDALSKDKNLKVREAAQKFLAVADMTLDEWAAANPSITAESALAARGGAEKPGLLSREGEGAPKGAAEIGSAAEPFLNGTAKTAPASPGKAASAPQSADRTEKGKAKTPPTAEMTPAAPAGDAKEEAISQDPAAEKPGDSADIRQSSAETDTKSAPAEKSEEPMSGENNPGIDRVKQLQSAPDGDFGPFVPDPSGKSYGFLLQKDLVEMVESAAEKNGLDAGTAVRELFGLVELQIGEAVTSYLSGAGTELAPEIDPNDRRYPTSPFSNHRLAVAQAGIYLDALWGDENPYVQGAVEEQLRAAGTSIEEWTDANPEKCYHPVNRMRGMELDAIAEPDKSPFGAFEAEPADVVVTFDRDGGQTGKVALPEAVFGCPAVVEAPKERFSYRDGKVNIEGACKVTATDGDERIELTVAACHLVSAMRKAGVCADAGPLGRQAQTIAGERAEQTPLRAQSRAKKAAQAVSGIFKPSRARSADEMGRS